ncbi:MAG: thiamine pyrophosphate-dependent dehydrogenase E1 component subunit alpha [Haliea sp.]|uniref:thiamine pyrophosphate-dependent dehydrogenase E1 component subunit alpha n=1 Tax=Haliea sp. TaxID=1932666 RepID=UPI0032EB6069
MAFKKSELQRAYRTMRVIREFEDRIHSENSLGNVPGFIHLSAGQEASAVGVCWNLNREDYISSTHRGHGHTIAKGCDVRAMMHEIFARASGLCNGKGGSMHMADIGMGMLGANGIVGAGAPLSCGAALAARLRGTDNIAVSFFGDGAYNEGAVLESLNLSKVLNLPIIFVLENNGYGEATPAEYAVAGDILKRAEAFGLVAEETDGHDFFAVEAAARRLIKRAREGKGPALLHSKLSRYYGHFEGDPATYRPKGEVDAIKKERDSLMLFRRRVEGDKLLTVAQLDEIDEAVIAEIDGYIVEAKQAPPPAVETLYRDAYGSY